MLREAPAFGGSGVRRTASFWDWDEIEVGLSVYDGELSDSNSGIKFLLRKKFVKRSCVIIPICHYSDCRIAGLAASSLIPPGERSSPILGRSFFNRTTKVSMAKVIIHGFLVSSTDVEGDAVKVCDTFLGEDFENCVRCTLMGSDVEKWKYTTVSVPDEKTISKVHGRRIQGYSVFQMEQSTADFVGAAYNPKEKA